MRIEVLENVKLLYQNNTKQICLVYHPIEQHFFIKKVLYDHFNVEIYETLKNYPHIGFARVYEVVIIDQSLVVIEEFVNGCTLEYEMSDQILERDIAIQYIMELFDVLQHLHSLTPPIIHRDIKPANLMICQNHMKLIDFDIAREFEQGQRKDTMVMGSVGYAAFEQYGFYKAIHEPIFMRWAS